MKVDLLDDYNRSGWRSGPLPVIVRRSVPFFVSPRGTRVHRIRSAVIYTHHTGVGSWMSVRLWCGQGGRVGDGHGMHLAEPLEGWPVCGTCEGRAAGAGQVSSSSLTDHPLLFTPIPGSTVTGRCEWTRWSYPWYASAQEHNCRSTARFVASKPGEADRLTCTYHSRQKKVTAEWTLTPIEEASR